MDSAGRWHVAFAVIPDPIPAPGNGEVVGIDRGVAVSAALSTGELLNVPRLTPGRRRRLLGLQRKLARARRGSNRRARVKLAIAELKAWEADARRDWCQKVSTDLAQRFDVIRVEDLKIAACGHVDRESRKSQARFRCTACRYTANADVNAARNIAVGHTVTARGGLALARPVNREPQPKLLPAT
jgi:transposase